MSAISRVSGGYLGAAPQSMPSQPATGAGWRPGNVKQPPLAESGTRPHF